MLRRFAIIVLVLSSAGLAAGCGGEQEVTTPAACLGPASEWQLALARAPDPVLLAGETRISDCLPANQNAADQGNVGWSAVAAATALSGGARNRTAAAENGPRGADAAYQAGYLAGALERGAEDSQGIHATLVDRVRSAASNGIEGEPPAIRKAFGEGRQAGLESG